MGGEGPRPHRAARAAASRAARPPQLYRGVAGCRARPGPPPASRGGRGGGGSQRLLEVSYRGALTTQNLPCSRARRELSAFKGRGGAGGPATQQQPRLRAVAGVRGPCARRAARRPTLHKGSMARPRLAGSPRRDRASPPGRGARPFHQSARPPPAPTHSQEGRPGRTNAAPGTQLRRAGGRRSHCDVSSLRGYLYPHDWISFMKPGPGVSVLWGAVAKVPQLYARPRDPGSQHAPGQPGAEPGRPRPFSSAVGRGGSGRSVLPSPIPNKPTRSRTAAGPLSQAPEK